MCDKPVCNLETVLDEIRCERTYQDEKWGREFDSKNTLNDWVTYICNYATQAANMCEPPSRQRKLLMKAAALAVAACEHFDQHGFAPRHYEDKVFTDDMNARKLQ